MVCSLSILGLRCCIFEYRCRLACTLVGIETARFNNDNDNNIVRHCAANRCAIEYGTLPIAFSARLFDRIRSRQSSLDDAHRSVASPIVAAVRLRIRSIYDNIFYIAKYRSAARSCLQRRRRASRLL